MIKVFLVKGRFMMGEEMQPFSRECRATSEGAAVEYILSDLGSKHRTPRGKIEVLEVKEIDPKDARDEIVRSLSGVEDKYGT